MEGSSTVVCDGHNWNSSAPICLSKSFHPFTCWSLEGDALVWAVTTTLISSLGFSLSWDFKITNLPYLVVFDQTNNLQRRRPCSLLDPGSGRSVSERASHPKPTRSHKLRISWRVPSPNPRPVPGQRAPGHLVQWSDLSGERQRQRQRHRQRHRQRQSQDKDNHGEVRPIKSPRLYSQVCIKDKDKDTDKDNDKTKTKTHAKTKTNTKTIMVSATNEVTLALLPGLQFCHGCQMSAILKEVILSKQPTIKIIPS